MIAKTKTIQMMIRTGILSRIPSITGNGATKMMSIHLKKFIKKVYHN